MLKRLKQWVKGEGVYPDIKRIRHFVRLQKPVTMLMGPQYKRSRKSIEINITDRCNLRCINCDMSCRQAPGREQMTVEQITKFIKESIDNNIKWGKIRLLGGEPTLHPDILIIFNLLIDYKENHSQECSIQLVTNGFGKTAGKILSKVPAGIEVENSQKKSNNQFFYPFNLAPVDNRLNRFVDYSNGCRITTYICGIGLTSHGYYPCMVAGGMDRVFGFDYGRKKMPSSDDSMIDLLGIFCGYCGHFIRCKTTRDEIMSPTWKKAYEKYKNRKPILSLY